jgi:hypothetical protein
MVLLFVLVLFSVSQRCICLRWKRQLCGGCVLFSFAIAWRQRGGARARAHWCLPLLVFVVVVATRCLANEDTIVKAALRVYQLEQGTRVVLQL